tara:strand:- start:121 stop:288 length:168 start_codon:yes stop_codon:yes gene_type:complete
MKTHAVNIGCRFQIKLKYSDFEIINNDEPILCNHCLRTASNGIRCMGICVADNDY